MLTVLVSVICLFISAHWSRKCAVFKIFISAHWSRKCAVFCPQKRAMLVQGFGGSLFFALHPVLQAGDFPNALVVHAAGRILGSALFRFDVLGCMQARHVDRCVTGINHRDRWQHELAPRDSRVHYNLLQGAGAGLHPKHPPPEWPLRLLCHLCRLHSDRRLRPPPWRGGGAEGARGPERAKQERETLPVGLEVSCWRERERERDGLC